ncbi:MAG: hypothetical protein AB1646_26125 [Thermodesulfobacteriota bacterium]
MPERAPILSRLNQTPGDLTFVGLLLCCVLMAVGGIRWNIEKQTSATQAGGARRIDLPQIRKQISEGELSSKKAMFFRKVAPYSQPPSER